jgi:branched-chain amino acid aminotransferase
MELKIEKLQKNEVRPVPTFDKQLGFGKHFVNHMFQMTYQDGAWQDARISALSDITLRPSAMVFHYGQAIFEGLKAYRKGDEVFLFRPMENMKRMNNSAARMAMPSFDKDFVIEAIKKLVTLEKEWIPEQKGYSLYIRPTMIATEPFLGVRASSSYLFFVIAGPVGPYYVEGFNPIDIYVTEEYARSIEGGVGSAKVSGNYAASLVAQNEGSKLGCGQVLWLDGRERKYIDEVGAMNFFVKFKDELATPNLTGTILPGVTRDSILQVAAMWGIKTSERKIALDELLTGIESGRVEEVFGCGTAAVIAPVKTILFRGKKYQIGRDGKAGPLSTKLFDYMTSLQCGLGPDPLSFIVKA